MKRIASIIAAVCLLVQANAQQLPEWTATPGTSLTMVNKLSPTENPYRRLETERYEGFTSLETRMSRYCTGLVLAFRTDSPDVGLKVTFMRQGAGDISALNSSMGFDLYVLKDGRWVWAGSRAAKHLLGEEQVIKLSSGLGDSMKECLLYFPHASEITSLDVLTRPGSAVEASVSPFKGRIVMFGSSFTNGNGCSRCGMLLPAQLTRMTGYNIINMGFAGRCKLQDYFAEALSDAENVDAYLFDAFSNTSLNEMREKLFPFIETFRNRKPGVPLIFLKSIYREARMAHDGSEEFESARMALADSLMRVAVRRYDNVYWVTSSSACGKYHECTTDGVHPDNHGYTLWAESISKPVRRILRRYVKEGQLPSDNIL